MITYEFLVAPTTDQLKQILSLYRKTGWWSDSEDNPVLVAAVIDGSHCFMVAEEEKGIIGMGRAISDGISDAYIQDVTVDNRYQGQGIGTRIIRKLVDRLHKDELNWIGLIAERNSHRFYERLGFKKMPDSVPMLMISE
jgi:aralkylamine N-acetyltransferase